jgi:hypothetical protein
MSTQATALPPVRARLADDLARLLVLANGRALPVAHAVVAMEDRGYAFGVLLLAFPFVLPVPSLGMALPIGTFLALAGLVLARGGTPSLPAFLQRRQIAYPALRALAGAADRARGLGGVLQPRLAGLTSGPARAAIGLSLFCAAFILALPIPLPLSNFFPAVAILMLAVGLIEGDGMLVLAGHLATLALCGGLYFAWGVARLGIERALAWGPFILHILR